MRITYVYEDRANSARYTWTVDHRQLAAPGNRPPASVVASYTDTETLKLRELVFVY